MIAPPFAAIADILEAREIRIAQLTHERNAAQTALRKVLIADDFARVAGQGMCSALRAECERGLKP